MYIIDSIFNVSSLTETTFDTIIAKLGSKEMLDMVLPIRHAKTKEERDTLKRMLPAFTLCKFNGRADSQGFISTSYIIYDIDGLNKKDGDSGSSITPSHAIDIVSKFALFTFVSPSGNGIKMVIQMDREMDIAEYRYNRKYYRDILSAETGLKLDDAYNAYHTFFSYTKDVKLNPDPFVFTAISPQLATQNSDVNEETLNKGEIADIKDYLAKQKLDYFDWTVVCFALQKTSLGKEMFKAITEGDNSPDHRQRNWEKKWNNCQNPTSITIRSLYHVAFKHGYKRKEKFIEEGRGKYLPFIIKDDGMYYKPKDKPSIRIFGFTAISIQYSVYDPLDGNRICLEVNGTELILKSTVLMSASEFRKAILSMAKCNPYMITSSKYIGFYDQLFDYMDKTKNKLIVKSLPGVGRIDNSTWNLGSIILFNGKVLPYDPLLIYGESGYALEDTRSEISIKDNPPLLKRKLNLMHDTYKEWAATAIGWAVINIFFNEIMHEFAEFPILFLFGNTSSGKSKLAHIILAMFGIKNPQNASRFKVGLGSATKKGTVRLMNECFCIPHFFDEYTKDHYHLVKNIFEGAGDLRAKKTNDSQVSRSDIDGGAMFASVNRDTEGEAINRCVYINMNDVKNTDPGAATAFMQEFISEHGLSEISSFIMHVICERSWMQFLSEYRKLKEFIEESLWRDNIHVDSRTQNCYALVGAGYNLCRGLFENHVPNEWWVVNAIQTEQYATESNPVDKFLDHVYGFAVKNKFPNIIFMEDGDTDNEYILLFHIEQALNEVRLVERLLDNLITLSPIDLGKKLRAHKNYLGDTSRYVFSDNGINKRKIRVIKMKYIA